MKTEVFFTEDEAVRKIRKLESEGKAFQVSRDDYWDLDQRIDCIVIDYEGR